MNHGIKNWEKKSIRYDQTENSFETILKKIFAMYNIKAGYLFFCGLSAASCLYEGMGWLTDNMIPRFPNGDPGGVQIQFDDWIGMLCNNPKNLNFTKQIMPNNMYGMAYVELAWLLFKRQLRYQEKISFDICASELKKHNGLQICLKEPAHWLAVINYREHEDKLIYNDSWGNRPGNKNGGLHEEITRADFKNVKDFMLVYEADK